MLLNSQRLLKPLKITNSCSLTRTLFTTKYLLSNNSEESQNNHQFNNTLLLPKTDFPLRNDILKTEAKYRPKLSEELYEWQLKNNNGDQFILHDGPPYANGDLHLGHALNKIIKDIINRFELLKGKKINYIPGWDCHGLPIELKVTSKLKGKKLEPLETRKLARELALTTVKSQLQEFKSYGVMADWNTTYKTLSKDYVIRQLNVVKNLVKSGIFYRQFRPVYWSPSSQTALAESELEYNEKHTSKSAYVKFELNNNSELLKEFEGINLLIWTTTPWTLPANQAVSVNPELTYSIVKTAENVTYIVAKDLISSLESILGELTTLKQIQGSDLQGLTYKNPLTNEICPILMGDHVTNVSGTGLVHTAPAHGMDDYLVCKAHGIHAVNLVNDYGKYNSSAGEELQGKSVLGEGNQLVIDKLTQMGHLIHLNQIVHSYPYDWRTKKPVIQRATPQWFANLEGLSSKALDSLKNIETIPPSGKNRLQSFIGLRTEWCVSRQRAWGVPIPVFYDTETGEALLTPDSIDFVIGKLGEFDVDAWWTLPAEDLIHPKYLESGKKYVKGFDTLDVWFDSGTSWTLINELFPRDANQPVADVYFEGSDQHRGWFQSSLLTSISQVNKAPFKTLITHGFVLDNKGQKMSKSLGNIIEPKTVINGSKGFPQYGADLLRYWAASSEFVKEVSVGKESLKIINNTFKKLRNTSRFLLGNLNEFDPKTQAVEYNKLTELDKFALHQLYQFHKKVTNHYNKYQFNQVVQELNRYTSADLSSFYLDCRKDRLYADDPSSVERLSTQTVLFEILKVYNQSLAPLVPHLAEEIFDYSKNLYELKSPENPSVFHNQWVELPTEWDRSNSEFETNWQFNLKLRNLSNRVIGQARDSGFLKSSLEVELAFSFQNLPNNIQFNEEELSQLCITSNISVISPEEFSSSNIEFKLDETLTLNNSDVKVLVGVRKSKGFKCPRCWVYSAKSENCLCSRCSKVVKV